MAETHHKKQHITAAFTALRIQVQNEASLLRRKLDMIQHFLESIKNHPWEWASCAAIFRGLRKTSLKESMAGVADFKEEYHPQSWERLKASIRTRLSVWIGLAAFVGWVLSRILPKKQRTYVPRRIREANYRSEEIKSSAKSKQLKDQGGTVIVGAGTSWSHRHQSGATLFQILAFCTHRKAPQST
jgi:hypothetical protein